MKTKLLISILALASMCSAAPLPDAPGTVKRSNPWVTPFKSPIFWAGQGFFVSGAIADVHSTLVCERNHTCFEAYRGHDSYGYIAPQIGIEFAAAYGCKVMLHEHKYWSLACLAIPVGWGLSHWRDATHIYRNNLVARP